MAHLMIKNIGPIKNVDVELNRINVFLGPQSSGKSTIAKVLSFCQWLQKDVAVRQSIDHIDAAFVDKNLIEYHNISSYLDKELSEFHYTGRCVDIDYVKGNISVRESGGYTDAIVAKNAYIPSERNIIGVPQSLSMDMPYNYLRSFLSDWMNVRDKYRRSEAVRLMNLGVSYFYNENSADDMIMIDGCPDRPISLSQASSGLQSTTPLYVYIKYLTEWVYQHDEDRSPQRLKLIREGSVRAAMYAEIQESIAAMFKEAGLEYNVVSPTPETKKLVENFVEKWSDISDNINGAKTLLERVREIERRLMRPKFSNIIVEEPEQNLFPQTQACLIYDILGMIDLNRDNLTITTHSPFVIYALNNCMMANMAGDKVDRIGHLGFGRESWTNPADVSVWELRDGYLQAPGRKQNETIQDDNGLIRDNYFDRVMKGLMVDFKNLLTVTKS